MEELAGDPMQPERLANATRCLAWARKGTECQSPAVKVICRLLSGAISILELATREGWNGAKAQAGGHHRQAA
jgi:hypothetical protein